MPKNRKYLIIDKRLKILGTENGYLHPELAGFAALHNDATEKCIKVSIY